MSNITAEGNLLRRFFCCGANRSKRDVGGAVPYECRLGCNKGSLV